MTMLSSSFSVKDGPISDDWVCLKSLMTGIQDWNAGWMSLDYGDLATRAKMANFLTTRAMTSFINAVLK